MADPNLPGYIIDYRTAFTLFASNNNARISHCITMVGAGTLFVCHEEQSLFKGEKRLRDVFYNGHDCEIAPDSAVLAQCCNISGLPIANKLLKRNLTPIYITAASTVRGYGVICDPSPTTMTDTRDLCSHYGRPLFTADEYFVAIGI